MPAPSSAARPAVFFDRDGTINSDTGYTYRPDDLVFEDQGVKVFIDPESFPTLDGTEVDFVRQGLNESFQFRNPNAKAECGCGESFTV